MSSHSHLNETHTSDPDLTVEDCPDCQALVAARNKVLEAAEDRRERNRIQRLVDEANRIRDATAGGAAGVGVDLDRVLAAVIVASELRRIEARLDAIETNTEKIAACVDFISDHMPGRPGR